MKCFRIHKPCWNHIPRWFAYATVLAALLLDGACSFLLVPHVPCLIRDDVSITPRWRTSPSRGQPRPATSLLHEARDLVVLELHGNATGSDVPLPTENGGYTHTAASKAKIGAANRGKTPWNKGKERSPEVKARIAAGVRARNRERFLKKLQEQGLTEEEYLAQKKEERRKKDAERRSRRTPKGGYRPTEETKAKISKILKDKYARGEMKPRVVDPSKVRRGFKHSEETRKKISESLRQRWANDPEYRANQKDKVGRANSQEDVRRRISESLKKKWQDPEFRSQMLDAIASRKSSERDDSKYRNKISVAMKQKWQDKEFRDKAMKAMRRRPTNSRSRGTGSPNTMKNLKDVHGPTGSVRVVSPLKAGEASSSPKRKTQAHAGQRLYDTEEAEVAPKPVKQKTKASKKSGTKKKKKPKPKEPEPDGSVNRLREERRDLFDLLYGDEESGDDHEEETNGVVYQDPPQDDRAKIFAFGDEDLDSFDPYGLEDY